MAERADFHEDFGREEEVVGSSERSFGLVFSAFFGLVAAFKWWHDNPQWLYWAGTAVLFLVLALAAPAVLKPLNRLWMKLGLLLHKVVTPVIMGLLFFVCVAPMGMVMRLFGKDFIRLRLDPAAESYWIRRDPPGPAPETMQNQF